MRIALIDSYNDLHKIQPEWRKLASNAVEQNINYEPEALLSLLRNLDYPGWFVVGIYQESHLIGIIPMQRVSRLPAPVFQCATLFQNHFLSCIPLIHKEYKTVAIDAFWQWVNHRKKGMLLYFSEFLPNSKLGNELLASGKKCGATVLQSAATSRAIGNVSETDFQAYLKNAISAKGRSGIRRKQRKLEQLGTYQIKFATQHRDVITTLLDDLIQVEGSGWKRENGSAIIVHPGLQTFIHEIAHYAASQNRLLVATSYIDEVPVAGFIGLINDGKLLVYKLGFDEQYAQYSVGESTFLGLIEHTLTNDNIHTIDSCAAPDLRMFNRCLPERQTVFEYQVASNHWLAKACVVGVEKTRNIRLFIKSTLSKFYSKSG